MSFDEANRHINETIREPVETQRLCLGLQLGPEMFDFFSVLLTQRFGNALLIGKKLVERSDGSPRPSGNLAHSSGIVPAFGEHRRSGL